MIKILRKGFISETITVTVGAIFAQLITLVLFPILTRLYLPDTFGLFSVVLAISGVAAIVVTLRYELALPLIKDDGQARDLIVLIMLFVVCACTMLGVAGYIYSHAIASILHTPKIADLLWLVGPMTLATALFQMGGYSANRVKRFKLYSLSRIVQSVVQGGVQIISGLFAATAFWLIVGRIVGGLFGASVLLPWKQLYRQRYPKARLIKVAAEHHQFPKYTLVAGVINAAGTQLSPLFISLFFSSTIVGLYSLTTRILSLPSILVAQAIAQVFYPNMSDTAISKEVARERIENVTSLLLYISVPVFLGVALTAQQFFPWIFGKEWSEAGLYAVYLVPWLLTVFISSPLSSYALVRGRQRTALYFSIYEIAVRIPILIFGAWTGSIETALILYSVSGAFISVVYINWILTLCGSNIFNWLWSIRYFVIVSAVILALCLLIRLRLTDIQYVIFSLVSMSLLGIYGLTRIMRHDWNW
ncbi:MAG: oligosaccharide flippase family protein [Gammaproteobacteria bacterium]